MGLSTRRHRPLHLPSRRRKGHRRDRARFLPRSGHARSRTRRYRRLRQHVGAHRPVRARTRPRAGPAAAIASDLAGPGLHRELRHAAARRVTLAAVILALVTVQRLGELVLSRYNTAQLLARGAIEIARGSLSADRRDPCRMADRIVGVGPRSGRQSRRPFVFVIAAGVSLLGACNARTTMDHAHHRLA